ncbi:MAG TPA: heat-inducible transcription repressor HrcA [Firmicutes bacterium]|nr:heat-inducible transcription repressor HrcA [Bacillota bacterium]
MSSQRDFHDIDERKKLILRAVTDEYISTAEPVGSRSIARRYNLGISPATIRNEMADLEEAGYLEQPHTSSGRIPSDKGYRFYVDVMLEPKEPSRSLKQRILREFIQRQGEIEALIQHTAKILATLTNQAALVISPSFQESTIQHIRLLPLDEMRLLVVLVTDPGFVNTRIVELSRGISGGDIERISGYLNGRLKGLTIRDLRATLVNEIQSELSRYRSLAEEATSLLVQALDDTGPERIYREGTVNMLGQPEFQDVKKVKGLLEVLEEDGLMFEALSGTPPGRGTEVVIGHENRHAGLYPCSIVSASYEIKGRVSGAIGIIGPTRMDYSRIVALVKYVSECLSEFLSEA